MFTGSMFYEMIASIHTASLASLVRALFKFSSHSPPTAHSPLSHPFHIHPLPVESRLPASAVPSDAILSSQRPEGSIPFLALFPSSPISAPTLAPRSVISSTLSRLV